MIKIKSVTKSYGDYTAIENINLTVEDSSVLGIAGFNGSGKTTLLNICAGVYKADKGGAYLDGTNAFDNDNERQLLFYLSESLYFPPGSTIKSAAKYYASYYPLFDMSVLLSVCEIFGLKPTKSIRSLSKGMKKQASLAIAFATNPKYLLIDETFDGLDPHKKELLKNLLLEYINDTNASVIIASHDLAEISGVCDQVAILNGKNIVLNCPIEDISEHYRRVTLNFNDTVDAKAFTHINHRKLKIAGQQVSMTIMGDIDAETEKLEKLGAQSIESVRLTLEEVFIEETEAESVNEKIKSIFKKSNS